MSGAEDAGAARRESRDASPAFLDVRPGDAVRLRKPHACGGRDWTVTRIGADIGLECATCARRVLLTRDDFERRCVRHVPASGKAESGADA